MYFATAKYGKAGRPPGGSHVSGGQGAGAPKVSGFLAVYVSRFSRNDDLIYGIVLGVYCLLAEGSGIFVLADSCPVALVVFAGSPEGRKEL